MYLQIFQNKGSTALPDPPPPQIFAHFPLRPPQQKWAKNHQTLLTGDRWINFRKVLRTGKLQAALITSATPSALLPMKWASISGVWDTTPFNREPLRTRFVVWVSGAECGSRIRPSPAFNGVALIPFLRGTLIICPISQGRWCWSFPNNLLLNFPADWPSSSTVYMLSQGDSTPGPTLERLSHQYYSAKQPLKENSFR